LTHFGELWLTYEKVSIPSTRDISSFPFAYGGYHAHFSDLGASRVRLVLGAVEQLCRVDTPLPLDRFGSGLQLGSGVADCTLVHFDELWSTYEKLFRPLLTPLTIPSQQTQLSPCTTHRSALGPAEIRELSTGRCSDSAKLDESYRKHLKRSVYL
jgi:hypothetical protein